MPAVKYFGGGNLTSKICNHYHDFLINRVDVRSRDGKLLPAQLMGLICNAGASMMTGGGIAKLNAVAISRGDGSTEDEWVSLADDEYVLCWRLPPGAHNGSFTCLVYVLIDDSGMPIVTAGDRYAPIKTAGVHSLYSTSARELDLDDRVLLKQLKS